MGLLSGLLQPGQNTSQAELVPVADIIADLERRVSTLEDTISQVIDELNGQTIQNAQNVQYSEGIQSNQEQRQ